MKNFIVKYRRLLLISLILMIACCYELWLFSQGTTLLYRNYLLFPKKLLIYSLISLAMLMICLKKSVSYNFLRFIIFFQVVLSFYSFYRSGKPIEKDFNIESKTYDEFFQDKYNIDRVVILNPVEPYHQGFNSSIAMLYRTPALGGTFATCLQRYAKFIKLFKEDFFKFKNKQVNYWASSFPVETTDFINRDNIHLINMVNVRYLAVKGFIPKITISDENYTSPFRLVIDKDIQVYENKEALYRAYIVHKVRIIKDEEDILKELADPAFEYKEYVIIENNDWQKERKEAQRENINKEYIFPQQLSLKEEYVDIKEYQANNILIETNLTNDGFLVLTDTYYPGWKVFVDGDQDDILRANYLFRGVFLKKGFHKVKFIYKPFSIKLGMIISVLSIIVLLSMFIYNFIIWACQHRRGKKR